MGYYIKNGGLVGSGAIQEVTGVHDLHTSGIFAGEIPITDYKRTCFFLFCNAFRSKNNARLYY